MQILGAAGDLLREAQHADWGFRPLDTAVNADGRILVTGEIPVNSDRMYVLRLK